MNKTLLAGALSLTLGSAVTSASATDIDITAMVFGATSAASGEVSSDNLGTTFNGSFFNQPWTATTQATFTTVGAHTWSGTSPQGAYSYPFTLTAGQVAFGTYFDWSVTAGIPVLAIFDCGATPVHGAACTGVPGHPMQVGPFPGQNPTFNGTFSDIAPTAFTSATSVSIAENSTSITYTAVSDGTNIVYSIDAYDGLTDLDINATSGVLSLDPAADAENALDANGDNEYEVTLRATNNSGFVTQILSVTVTNENDVTPVLPADVAFNLDENQLTTGFTAVATDGDVTDTLTYSIQDNGAADDGAKFRIVESGTSAGVLTFHGPAFAATEGVPDFEIPTDVGTNGVYEVVVVVTDSGALTDTQTVSITIDDVEPEVFSFPAADPYNFDLDENVSGVVYTATAIGNTGAVTYARSGGADGSLFFVNLFTGLVTLTNPADYESLTATGDNILNVTLRATDIGANGIHESAGDVAGGDDVVITQDVIITVVDLNDTAPEFAVPSASGTAVENQTNTTFTAQATDADTVGDLTYSIVTNVNDDSASFDIDETSGVVSFLSAPDADAGGAKSAAGTNDYVFDVEVTDDVNAVATQAVTITVTDAPANPPVITLPSCPITVVEGAVFTAPAAAAVDALDGIVSNDIVVDASAVDTSTPGTYDVTYNVSNSENDAAVEGVCSVIVNAAPQVFVIGAAVINITEGASYTDLGAKATDPEDGVISVTSSGGVNPSVAGTYDIIYSATDSNGSTATATRRVIVRGSDGAVLGVRTLSIEGGEFALADGAYDPLLPGSITPFTMGAFQGSVPASTAADTEPGSVYNSTSIAAFAFQAFGPVGVYTGDTDGTAANVGLALPSATVDTVNRSITLTAPSWIAYWNGNSFAQGATTANGTKIDAQGTFNPATNAYDLRWDALVVGGAFDGQTGHWNIHGTVDLVAADSVLPVVTLRGSSQVALRMGATYVESGVSTATDNIDQLDIANVAIAGAVDGNTVGVYTITYSIADSSGNVGVATREVVVFDDSMPAITLNGDATVNLEFNGTYVEAGATATGGITVIIAGTVDSSTVGSYIITYNAVDRNGNHAFQVTRTVNVIDVNVPVITPLGDNPVYLRLGEAYVDEGATATDDVDTNPGLTNAMVTDNPVDINTEGQYTVTYTVVDSEGHTGTATRTVFVDNTGPAITIIGNVSIALTVGGVFTDEGANALDGVSGTRDVTTDCSSVDTAIAGRYTCTYTATDDAGNETVVERVITILDAIVPTEPVLTLTATQDGEITSIVITGENSVIGDSVVTVITDIPSIPGFFDAFDWSATDNNLIAALVTVGDIYNTSLRFDPANLDPGTYEVVVTTNGGTDREVTSRKLLTVVTSVPELSSNTDTDGDGVSDRLEGIADDDNDGIPNFLDDSRLAVTEVSVDGSVMMSSTGILRLGNIAFAAADVATGQFSSQVDLADITEHGGSAGGIAPANADDSGVTSSCVGGCFDFDVADIEPGSTVDIVIPLSEPLGNNVVYRKYTTIGGWVDFDTSGVDAIATSGLVNGICPEPNATNRWVDGLFEGDSCIRLTIQDGGANDADGAANGVVSDPSGAADLPPAAGPKTGFADGCSATDRIVNPWERSDWLLIALFIALIGMRRKLLVR